MKKLTKIKKWASDKGFEIKEREYHCNYQVEIKVNGNLKFTVSEKESTLRKNIKGKYNGHAKGIYLAIGEKLKGGYSFQYNSQNDIIEKMNDKLELQ